jgi:hypothetical protein
MKKNWLLIGGVAAAAWYFFLRNKKIPGTTTTTVPKAPATTNVPIKETVVVVPQSSKKYEYPLGIGMDGSTFPLNEGDYVANGVETAILFNGQLRPVTAAYVDRYGPNSWSRTKILDNIVYSSIPRGAVLDI